MKYAILITLAGLGACGPKEGRPTGPLGLHARDSFEFADGTRMEVVRVGPDWVEYADASTATDIGNGIKGYSEPITRSAELSQVSAVDCPHE